MAASGTNQHAFVKIMVNMWVLILFYVTRRDLKKKHVYTYCLSTVYRVGAQYSRIRNLGFLKLH